MLYCAMSNHKKKLTLRSISIANKLVLKILKKKSAAMKTYISGHNHSYHEYTQWLAVLIRYRCVGQIQKSGLIKEIILDMHSFIILLTSRKCLVAPVLSFEIGFYSKHLNMDATMIKSYVSNLSFAWHQFYRYLGITMFFWHILSCLLDLKEISNYVYAHFSRNLRFLY